MEQQVKEFESLAELLEDLDREGITGNEKFEAVNSFLSSMARIKGKPFVASFELTPLCNFDCKMCYVHLNKAQMQERELLTVEQWKRIIDMAVNAGIMYADITGGECLTYPGFKEVYLHLWHRGVRPSVLTNASLLTDEMAGFFQKYPPRLIQISVYGSNAEAYKRVTGRDAYEAVMAGIQRLKEKALPFKLIITPSRYMQDDAEALLKLLQDMKVPYGVGGVTLAARPETGREVEDYRIDTAAYIALQKSDTDYRLKNGVKGKKTEYKFAAKGYPMRPGLPCSSGKNSFHINWKGEMMPCISFHSVTSSVLDKSFDEAWKEIKEKLESYREPEKCGGCKYRPMCTSCPAEKCYGELGGELNTSVCERLKCYIAAGLVVKGNETGKDDCNETDICEAEGDLAGFCV